MIRTEQTLATSAPNSNGRIKRDSSKGPACFAQRHSQSGEDFFPTVFYASRWANNGEGRLNDMNVYPSPQ